VGWAVEVAAARVDEAVRSWLGEPVDAG
jgi:hypothetical protein